MYKILMHEYSDCCDKNAYILLNFIYLYFVYFVYFVYLVYFSVNPKGNITQEEEYLSNTPQQYAIQLSSFWHRDSWNHYYFVQLILAHLQKKPCKITCHTTLSTHQYLTTTNWHHHWPLFFLIIQRMFLLPWKSLYLVSFVTQI